MNCSPVNRLRFTAPPILEELTFRVEELPLASLRKQEGKEVNMGPFLQVGGEWDIVQHNGFRVRMNVHQEQDRLNAFASHSNGSVQSTEATGFVRGPDFEITITWNNGTRGLYTGRLSHGPFTPPSQGFLKGSTKDLNNPGSVAGWETERIFHVA
jgi:hypothetical protein